MQSEKVSFGYYPGGFKLSNQKIKNIIKILNLEKSEIKELKKNQRKVANAVKTGDTQLARIICLNPLLIACYSDEFESVLIYRYPTELVKMYYLRENQILITSNMYWHKECFDLADDILKKDDMTYHYRDAITFIPLFLCKNEDEILKLTKARETDYMVYALDMAILEYLEKMPHHIRDGFKTLIHF